jgi:signal transduction histidine kinase
VHRLEIDRDELIARLAEHRLIGKAPRAELEWLAAHGELRRYDAGSDAIIAQGERVDDFYVLLKGRFAFFVDRGAGERKVTEWRTGDLMGVLPYSRLTHSPGKSITEEDADVLAINREHIEELKRECPFLTTVSVHVMLDRARIFNASDLQDEKMISLGRLSAGLAHELNNPASAAARSASLLTEAVVDADAAARRLGALKLNDDEVAAIDAVRDACLATNAPVSMSPLERADREDEISDWLAAHKANVVCAVALAETPVTTKILDTLATSISDAALDTALCWIAAGCTVRALSREVETSAARIHTLVGAVKRFTHMDQPLVQEAIALEQGLRDTVTVLGSKARAKGASVTLDFAPGIPRARVSPEINQVWTNLLDNALDAIPEAGRVSVTARAESGWVVVRVADNGPGISSDVAARVFDPFFTTKPVGHGTGLGLDIARRILRQWSGEIDFTSQPGKTEFAVRLPAEGN